MQKISVSLCLCVSVFKEPSQIFAFYQFNPLNPFTKALKKVNRMSDLTCDHCDNFNPVQCIVPPYISDKLMSSKNKNTVDRAVLNRMQSIKMRARREFLGGLSLAQRSVFHPAPKVSKKAKLNMQVFDMKHGTNFAKAQLIWNNGKAKKKPDKDAKNVIAAGAATWDLYYQIFGRNSLDNLGLLMRHYIHYYKKYDNAMWDGNEMVYGDGDKTIFDSFTSDPDIIGHELTHGVTQYESNLAYHNQSGALNESLSDVFGIMVKQRLMNLDVKQSNWLIGENVLLGKKYALRSLKAPGTAYVDHPDLGTDPQPATMNNWVQSPDTNQGDWGGVHTNSGITNYAFYLTANDIGGYSWDKAGRIWYAAMTDDTLSANATFSEFKNLTIQHAEKLFGAGGKESSAVKNAWSTAKV